MNKFKLKVAQWMYGRYGTDAYSRFLLGGALVSMIVSLFTGWNLFYVLAVALLAYTYYRMFSRNISKRYAENQAFSAYLSRAAGFFKNEKQLMIQRKTHHIYRCPSCRQKIRVPRGKGKIAIRCPKCSQEFIKRS